MALFKKETASQTEKKKFPVVLIVICSCVVLLLGFLIGYLYYDTNIEHDKILDNVYVAGVNVGGKTKLDAVIAVRNATSGTYTVKPMTITFGKETQTITPELSGANLDVDAAVNAAHAYGRQGFVFRRKYEQMVLAHDNHHLDITEFLHLNTDAIRNEITRLAEIYNCDVVQTVYSVDGNLPDEASETPGNRKLHITLGTAGYVTKTNNLYQSVIDAYNKNNLKIAANCTVTEPDVLDLDAIFAQYCLAPVDATMDNSFVITDEKKGYGFDVAQLRQELNAADYGKNYSFEFHELEPAITRQSIEAELFKDVLSEYTAESGSLYNRDINLKLSCEAVNGTILLPGEIFDYNSALGERTPEKGYRLGNTYSGMETIQTYGGGICQTSSTLYYCAMLADLEIVKRTNHSFLNTYVPFGMDATVNWGTLDFQFKNNSDYPIKIEAYSDAGDVTIRILGTDYKDYYVKMEYEIWGVSKWTTVYQELPPDNPKGYKDGQVIATPYTGYTVQTFRCKYDKNTDALISRDEEAYSVYTKRDNIICKIVDPAAVPDPNAPAAAVPPATPTEPTTPPVAPSDPGIVPEPSIAP